MGNLGATEILLILLVVLLLFGAKRIPEIARGLGKGIREFKDATHDIKREISLSDAPPPQIPPPHAQPYPHAPGTYAAPPAPPHAVPVAPPAGAPPAAPPATPVADEPPPSA